MSNAPRRPQLQHIHHHHHHHLSSASSSSHHNTTHMQPRPDYYQRQPEAPVPVPVPVPALAPAPAPAQAMVLPEWQPDASAKSCPICYSVFTWFNRRHHCRKCGRVVCASCSPHRIVIPAAFVVHPPPQPRPAPPPTVIDLTGPDPIPRHIPTIDLTQDDDNEEEDDSEEDETEDDDEDDDEDGGYDGDEALEVRMCDQCLVRRDPNPAYPATGYISPPPAAATSSTNSPQRRRRRRHDAQDGVSPPPNVPQLAETDYCPICHRALPHLADSSEAGREAHISACIATAASPPGRQRSFTNGGRMVVWRVSGKECVDADGTKVECVICFEDFEEGVEIARLECLCRYHKKCIRDWFDRKGNADCPVHAVHE